MHCGLHKHSTIVDTGSAGIFHMLVWIVDLVTLFVPDSRILLEDDVSKESYNNCTQSGTVNWNGVEILFSDFFS